jgi:beta-lactamase superfamily II metal-dependent hydrolase
MAEMMDVTEDAERGEEIGITFFYMGQGDCCMLSLPDGKCVLVDCGSKAEMGLNTWYRVHEAVRSKDGVGGGRLHALILTHPDVDHCNHVAPILLGATLGEDIDMDGKRTVAKGTTTSDVKVDHVYFSSTSQLAPLGAYLKGVGTGKYNAGSRLGTSASVAIQQELDVKELHLVTINATTRSQTVWEVAAKGYNALTGSTKAIGGNELLVAGGTTKAGTEWSVSIIAGHVPKGLDDKSDTDGSNAASLVTLVRFGTDRALICGDATASTERFLLAAHRDAITGLRVMQVPHHGSFTTSSKDPFVTVTRPRIAVVSVDFMEHSHYLPDKGAIVQYLACTDVVEDEPHFVDYWELASDYTSPGVQNAAYVLRDRWMTQKPPIPLTDFDGNPVVPQSLLVRRADFEGLFDKSPDAQPVALNAYRGYALVRQKTKRSVWMTGVEGTEKPFQFFLYKRT